MNQENQKKSAPRLLGNYLPCSRGVIRMAMQKKREAKLKGEPDKLIGQILIELTELTNEDIEIALRLQRADRLALCPVFETLTHPELIAMGKNFREINIAARQQFIMEGENDPSLYVVASGQVEVFKISDDDDDDEIHIAFIEPYEPIGEMGYFHGGHRTASARTVGPTCLLSADYSNLTHYFEYVPRVAYAFMDLVQQRQAQAEKRMQEAQAK